MKAQIPKLARKLSAHAGKAGSTWMLACSQHAIVNDHGAEYWDGYYSGMLDAARIVRDYLDKEATKC